MGKIINGLYKSDKDYKSSIGLHFDRFTTYHLPRDLSVTFGTIFDNIRKWIKNDLKGIVSFNHEFVDTQLMGDQDYFWTSGLLGQARRPVLALQFNIDHLFEHPAYGAGYTFSAKESMWYLNKSEILFRIFAFEDDEDPSNNMEIRLAFKNIHINCHAGIVEVSRPNINNIAHYWHTVRQPNEQIYHFSHYVDFQIPDEVIDAIVKKFKVQPLNHHSVLRFLNHNSFVNVFYGMSGYDGKFYYFIRYPVKSFIKTEGMTNPEPWAEEGIANPEVYTIERDFSADVLVPMFMSFSTYGDRIILDNEISKDDKWWDISITEAAGSLHERYIEVERVFKNKHEIGRFRFKWTTSDLLKHPSGTTTTKKIDLTPFLNLDYDEELNAFYKWATEEKKYKNIELFNFQLFQDPGIGLKNIEKNNPLRKPIESEEDEQLYALIPNDNNEYQYYLKNMEDFFIVDFKPDLNRELFMVVYCNLAIYNQYLQEVKPDEEKGFANDDAGYNTGYGISEFNRENNKV